MAAGGWKIFTAGDVLTADDTMDYLQQGVLVFDSSGARGSAIASPVEGQFSYLKDTDSTEYYDGAAWTQVAQGGLVHIVTESFSAVSSVSLDNCFSGDYDNYRVLGYITGTSTSNEVLRMRMRSSGTDNSASNYRSMTAGIDTGGTASNLVGAATQAWDFIRPGATNLARFDVTVMTPQLAQPSSVHGTGSGLNTGNTASAGFSINLFHDNTGQFDGFSLIPNSGTISGVLYVYGYRK